MYSEHCQDPIILVNVLGLIVITHTNTQSCFPSSSLTIYHGTSMFDFCSQWHKFVPKHKGVKQTVPRVILVRFDHTSK